MAQTNDDQLKAKVDAYVDEVWEDVVEDIRTLVRIESVEDLSAAEPGKPYGPKANEALVAAEGIASRLGLAVTDLDGCIGYGYPLLRDIQLQGKNSFHVRLVETRK